MHKDNPNVRDAVYEAFRGECFYTGRSIKKKKLVIAIRKIVLAR